MGNGARGLQREWRCLGYSPHDHARSRAYRWGEDGIAGFGDDQLNLCLGLALWNGQDPILKERLFGLTNSEGNHGEDVKELYYYLDATPSHNWMRMLYKYPQLPFPMRFLSRKTDAAARTTPSSNCSIPARSTATAISMSRSPTRRRRPTTS